MLKELIDRKKSKLTDEYLKTLTGLSSANIRHALNNLGAISNNYLEVGTYMGSTLLATAYENKHLNIFAIDNFCMKPKTRGHFFGNVKGLNFTFIEDDAFKVNLKKIDKKIDLYFYDGEHSYESQYNAIKYFLPVMADEFIYVCDDWTNEPVREGTLNAIADCGLNIVEVEVRGQGQLKSEDWWCGFAVMKLKKS